MVTGQRTRRGVLRALAAAAAATAFSRPSAAADLRLVSLDLQLTEMLVSLARPPVAAADNALYRRLVERPALPDDVADLGPIQQPNLEVLQLLKPDAILVPAWTGRANRAPLARVARVEVIGSLTPTPALERLDTSFLRVAAIVGRTPEAEALITRRDEVCARGRSAAWREPTYLCRLIEDGRHVALFGSKSVVGAIAQKVGLTLAWTGRQSAFGTSLIAVEDLAAHPDARILHFDRGPETARALRRLQESPLWNALPVVRRREVIATPVVHPNGGVASATRFAEQLAAIGSQGRAATQGSG